MFPSERNTSFRSPGLEERRCALRGWMRLAIARELVVFAFKFYAVEFREIVGSFRF